MRSRHGERRSQSFWWGQNRRGTVISSSANLHALPLSCICTQTHNSNQHQALWHFHVYTTRVISLDHPIPCLLHHHPLLRPLHQLRQPSPKAGAVSSFQPIGTRTELIQASDDLEYYVNEDAIRLGLPVNKHLTKLKGTIVLVKHSSAGDITKLPQGITLDNWKSNVFPHWK